MNLINPLAISQYRIHLSPSPGKMECPERAVEFDKIHSERPRWGKNNTAAKELASGYTKSECVEGRGEITILLTALGVINRVKRARPQYFRIQWRIVSLVCTRENSINKKGVNAGERIPTVM